MKIYLDDVREAPEGWERFYKAGEVMEVLVQDPGRITAVSLDNDLGAGEVEGVYVAKLIAALAKAGMLLKIGMIAHTDNPIAKQRMHSWFRVAAAAWRGE